ncbi:hypothetical protein [endosymbiont GvMRE of Glomus versiforme]|uniref:hypothetical protein n=1 Tax=endosymbiont GvMRE of Glomus versiforme TaxID=2039283 RepID=UPI000ECC3640|nr:hypothetical protein [endosymbiont GvMRE of Glomus versiforme]RHZ35732.1 hypothetical protein GvMRE_Ic6g31 [endosymbiont GvMRE of Glomus versiforme]
MEVKALLKYYRQDEFLMSSGKKIFIEIKLWKLATDKPEFPEGYKFKWMAFNRDNPREMIRFDNHRGKGPHYHENGTEVFFIWKSRQHTQQMFYQMIIKKFGNFIQKL